MIKVQLRLAGGSRHSILPQSKKCKGMSFGIDESKPRRLAIHDVRTALKSFRNKLDDFTMFTGEALEVMDILFFRMNFMLFKKDLIKIGL